MAALAAVDSGLDELLTLNGFLQSHASFWLWFMLLTMIAEIFTSGFFLGALGVSALLTAGGAWLGLPAEWQLVLFGTSSIGSLLWIRPVFVKLLSPRPVTTNADALVGQAGTVVVQVPAGGIGRVRLKNEEWRATSTAALQVGDGIQVLAVQGNTLTVGRV